MPDTDRAVAALKAAKNIVFFTGAGISAESGIPTFRDKLTGVWSTHDPEKLETATRIHLWTRFALRLWRCATLAIDAPG
jgi:NAD-dependent deacetylase